MMKSIFIYFPFVIILFSGCSEMSENEQSIVDKSIQVHGGELFENSIIDYDFRGRHYKLERIHGQFSYHRIFEDSGTYYDIYSNDNFTRLLNDQEIDVGADWGRRYSNSINSVAYFSLLPFGLNDGAVNKKLLGEEEVKGKDYYKIEVTFNVEDGGEDHEDVFVYWISKDDYLLQYFGYYYKDDGGGIRFREAVNTRKKGGIIFSDYINYKGPDGYKDVAGMAELFKNSKLKKLSEIRLENLKCKRYEGKDI